MLQMLFITGIEMIKLECVGHTIYQKQVGRGNPVTKPKEKRKRTRWEGSSYR